MKKFITTKIIATIISIVFCFCIEAMAIDCPPGTPGCGEIELPCIDCDSIIMNGPDENFDILNITAGGNIDIIQVQNTDFNLEPCKLTGDINTAQLITGKLQLPENDENATGTLNLENVSQYNRASEIDALVGNNTVTQQAQSFEKVVAQATADHTAPEANILIKQEDTIDFINEDFENGMKGNVAAASCLEVDMYGSSLELFTEQTNSFGYLAEDPNGSWQLSKGSIDFKIGTVPEPPTP